MVYHWQSLNTKVSGVDDMTLLSKISDDSIVENLKKRFMDDWIFTYIGPVLISVNPFKQMPYFGEKEIFMYQGAAQYENRPHIYSTGDNMYRNMLIDCENQCVIISGESGAGKTVAAKYIMNYISKISGGGSVVQHVKDVILESNPLLEAFGNAKTVRNNNSSRFGKYVEIIFGRGGQPTGGKISNFLLEKSRVVSISSLERSFHIFYQLCLGANEPLRSELALLQPDNFCYLSQSPCMLVDGTNDAADFRETNNAMATIGMSDTEQRDIFRIVAAVLHIGNIQFTQSGDYSSIYDKGALECPAALLEIDSEMLGTKLISRVLDGKWGRQTDRIDVTLGLEQALYTRDALSKALYARLFDFLVQRINQAMMTQTQGYTMGILDIYGFEIFQQNGFEQFCINYVNEKLQQIFIELTLKAEQEEYVMEGIKWTPVDYFNNQIVCELIEGTKPPGVLAILNDVCATLHNVTANADSDLQKKLSKEVCGHQHYQNSAEGFVIHHYAGIVQYNVQGFCDRNRDVLFPDLIIMMQSSRSQFIRNLFPEQMENKSTRPTTVGTKIKSQASQLVASLMKCAPHYVRCIKPNETKRARDWEDERVRHQVEYLGLKENVRVRRAGFAYRRVFEKFLQRYAILCNETWPSWNGQPQEGIKLIMAASYIENDQYQLGRTKIFIKAPESLFQLEELRERKFDGFARTIQRAFRKYFDKRQRQRQQEQASAIVFGKKQRRKYSINRMYVGDYIGLDHRPELLSLIARREKVEYAETVTKYDRRFKGVKRDLFITSHRLILIGREKLKQGPQKGLIVPIVKRDIQFPEILKVSLSTRQDDLLVIHVRATYDTVIESNFKTEFLTVLSKRFKAATQQDLNIIFNDSLEFTVKKQGFLNQAGTRKIRVVPGSSDLAVFKISGKVLTIEIGEGLPKNTYPRILDNDYKTPNSRPVKPSRHVGQTGAMQSQNGFNSNTTNQSNEINPVNSSSGLQSRLTIRQAPPPPTEPCPPNQPRIPLGAFRLPSNVSQNNNQQRFIPNTSTTNAPNLSPQQLNNSSSKFSYAPPSQPSNPPMPRFTSTKNNSISKGNGSTPQQAMADILKTPNAGASGAKRSSLSKPAPGAGRPKPKPKPPVKLPKCSALYDYDARDIDELTLKEGQVLEIVKEHDSGWWVGRLNGKEGLFPSNYVEKV